MVDDVVAIIYGFMEDDWPLEIKCLFIFIFTFTFTFTFTFIIMYMHLYKKANDINDICENFCTR